MKAVSIVGDSKLGVDFTELKMGVAVKTLMRVELHELGKGECPFEMGVHAGRMDGFVGTLVDCLQKPIYALFFSWGFSRIAVGKLAADFFKQVNVFGDVCAIYVPKLFNGFS